MNYEHYLARSTLRIPKVTKIINMTYGWFQRFKTVCFHEVTSKPKAVKQRREGDRFFIPIYMGNSEQSDRSIKPSHSRKAVFRASKPKR